MKNLVTLAMIFCSIPLFAQTSIVLQPGPEGKDAKIFNLDALANYGNDEEFIAAQLDYSGEPGTTRSIIEFDLSSIPKGVTITDAKLSLFYNSTSQTPGHIGDNASVLRRLIVAWDETTVAWNQQPAYTLENEVLIPASSNSTQDYNNIDVTQLVRDMVDHPNTSHGFIFMLQDEQFTGKSVKFYSGDTQNPDKRPKLVITYSTSVSTKEASYTPVNIHPNPFTTSLHVSVPSGSYNVTIFDLNSKVLFQNTLESDGKTLHVDDANILSPGIYHVKLEGKDLVYYGKAVKAF